MNTKKYYVIELKGKTSLAYHHTYADDVHSAITEAIQEQARLGNENAEIQTVTEYANVFKIGDHVRVSEPGNPADFPHHAEIGEVIEIYPDGETEPGWIVVAFYGGDVLEEFHFLELEKVS